MGRGSSPEPKRSAKSLLFGPRTSSVKQKPEEEYEGLEDLLECLALYKEKLTKQVAYHRFDYSDYTRNGLQWIRLLWNNGAQELCVINAIRQTKPKRQPWLLKAQFLENTTPLLEFENATFAEMYEEMPGSQLLQCLNTFLDIDTIEKDS